MEPIRSIYSSLCPVCGKDLSLEEIERGLCENEGIPLCEEDNLYREFIQFFSRIIGKPRAIQKMWAKRILRGDSFAAVAPTGVGKTSFGVAISIFLAESGRKCYIILPTTLLLDQVVSNIKRYAEKAGLNVGLNENGELTVAYYHGRMKKEDKERFFQVFSKADVLVSTTQFLSKHFNDIGSGQIFDFIFVDDVDAILKASKNVERILNLLGFYYEKGKGWKRRDRTGCLMVSTATAKKGKKAELFRKLLNFDVGSSTFTIRNIEDIAVNSMNIGLLQEILKRMGGGGLIYARNSKEAQRIYEQLKGRFKIGIVAGKKDDFEKFKRSEIDFLVGTAHYYGPLVRGLDLPERIRYVVFYGCPVFRIKLEDIEDPSKVSDKVVRILAMFLRGKDVKKLLGEKNIEDTKNLRKFLKKALEGAKVIKEDSDFVIRETELIIPDIRMYVQGSGRTSRLFSGGITKGVSFLIEADEDILKAFIKRARYYDIEAEVKSLDDIEFEKLKGEIDESRKKFERRGEYDVVKPALFIVESPTKAKHISRFFGRPSIRIFGTLVVYEVPTSEYVLLVTASLGHITDLITNRGFHGVEVVNNAREFIPVFSTIKRCLSCGYQFSSDLSSDFVFCPRCGSKEINDSKGRIDDLRTLAYETERVIIGTDPDSEGEKIAWDLKNLLSGCGEVKRAEFHEITKKAISNALENLREVDENLVKAQIVRRIEDRWIGFVLSHKLQEVFKDKNLSAGRAQTPVLGWILERTKENKERKKVAVIKDLDLTLDIEGVESIRSKPKAEGELEIELEIKLIEDEIVKRTPLPPYTTDTLLRDANRFLRLNAGDTMKVAQALFESGLITYHRTDSTRVSEAGLRVAREYLGDDFKGRDWYAEGAHECIRPTRPIDRNSLQRLIYEGVIRVEEISKEHLSLYDLIFRRFMASQCKEYRARIAKYEVKYDGKVVEEERVLSAEGRAYDLYKSVSVKRELPTGKVRLKAEIKEISKAPLYSQAEIIQLMRSKGIGRPSTYATILNRLFVRGYVFERDGRVKGTKRGFLVFDFLSKNYSELVSEKRTIMLEEKMDRIAMGELRYEDALVDLYEEIKSVEKRKIKKKDKKIH